MEEQEEQEGHSKQAMNEVDAGCDRATPERSRRRRRSCKRSQVFISSKECGGASICQHQRIRSRCKECREEADTSMPAGLEELAGPAHAAGKDL